MVDVLNIDCESDEEDEKSPELVNHGDPIVDLKYFEGLKFRKQNIKLSPSQGPNSSVGNSQGSKSDEIGEKKKTSGTKTSNNNSAIINESPIFDRYQ